MLISKNLRYIFFFYFLFCFNFPTLFFFSIEPLYQLFNGHIASTLFRFGKITYPCFNFNMIIFEKNPFKKYIISYK